MINIAIVDDQVLFRDSLANLIQNIGGFRCLHSCGDGGELLAALDKEGAEMPDIVLLDLEMPGMSGIELNKLLQKQYPAIRILILSVHANEKLIASLIREGADGYLTKNCDKEELMEALRMVYDKGYYINKMTLRAMQLNGRPTGGSLRNNNGIPLDLTRREVEILELICQEYSNSEIAAQLYISTRTVEGHRNNLLNKIGCRNTAGLVIFAIRHHIISAAR